jgi:hypothetical protein
MAKNIVGGRRVDLRKYQIGDYIEATILTTGGDDDNNDGNYDKSQGCVSFTATAPAAGDAVPISRGSGSAAGAGVVHSPSVDVNAARRIFSYHTRRNISINNDLEKQSERAKAKMMTMAPPTV